MVERIKRLMPTPESVAGNRWLRWMGPSLLHPRLWHLSRRAVAIGAAIGVFFAFITPIAQIPLSAAVSVALRANIPTAVVATLVNTPPTFGPVYYAAWWVGAKVLGESVADDQRPELLNGTAPAPAPAPNAQAPQAQAQAQTPTEAAAQPSRWARWTSQLQAVGKPLLVGTLIFSFTFSALAYLLVNGIWHWRVRRKRRGRLQARGKR